MRFDGRTPDVAVVGAGIFGVCAAEAFARRGAEVTLLDPGPVPHPRASSTDISKAIRSDYGDDRFFTGWARDAIEGWRRWNEESGRSLFHEVGFLACTPGNLDDSPFERDSQILHRELGVPVERWTAAELRRRFPAIEIDPLGESHFNPAAGWASSAAAVGWRLDVARRVGVRFVPGFRAARWIEDGTAVRGVESTGGERISAGLTLIAAGAWTPALLPELADRLRPSAQTVMHFDAAGDPRLQELPVWCADISRTGWYGFPADSNGRFKIGHHGTGRSMQPASDPAGDRPADAEPAQFRQFVASGFPRLRHAAILESRVCYYCDSFDGDFWIDRHPQLRGAMVAAGGSGHGFKFAPLLGDLIADIAEGLPSEASRRFRWRQKGPEIREKARSSR